MQGKQHYMSAERHKINYMYVQRNSELLFADTDKNRSMVNVYAYIFVGFIVSLVQHFNNIMLSLVIHSGYEGSDIAEKNFLQ
jgi:hypothetical protein